MTQSAIGQKAPRPEELRTGDLLFPRKTPPADGLEQTDVEVVLRGIPMAGSQQRLRDWLAIDGRPVDAASLQASAFGAVHPWRWEQLSDRQPRQTLMGARPVVEIDLNDWRIQSALIQVMSLVMADELEEWLNTTVRDFIRSSLGRFLLDTLGSTKPSELFFHGHVAMVLRSEDGLPVGVDTAQGQVHVIEATATDYGHYRVSLHPYEDAVTRNATQPGERVGWVDRRLGLGESVWMARVNLDAPTATRVRAEAAQWALTQLGRPYAMLDKAQLGEGDCYYCSEFVHAVFKEAAKAAGLPPLNIADRCQWGWTVEHLKRAGSAKLAEPLREWMTLKGYGSDRPFFLLAPAMLWDSARVERLFYPEGQGEYAARVPLP